MEFAVQTTVNKQNENSPATDHSGVHLCIIYLTLTLKISVHFSFAVLKDFKISFLIQQLQIGLELSTNPVKKLP